MPSIDMRKHPIYKYLFVDDGDEHVVYRFRFKEDGAEYYGISQKKRVMVRWFDHHSDTLATSEALTYRLQKKKEHCFDVLSCHPSKKAALREEKILIEKSPNSLNGDSKAPGKLHGPEGPNPVYAVYRYRFKDGATYCGSASEVRVGFRCHEHRWTTRGNMVLHARLQKEKDYELFILSKHPDKESALQAEDDCIRKARKTINAKGARPGGPLPNSIYEKEKRARKLDRKSLAKALAQAKERQRENTRQRRRRLMAAGLCIECCGPKDQASMALQRCRKCLDAINKYRRRKRSKK